MRLDYGPEAHLGRTTTLPAVRGEDYPALVSQVDGDSYNETAGIRLPDLTVPVATYTGWNQRHPDIGNPDLYIGITGGLAGWVLPLPATREDREASSDPRPSIEERYRPPGGVPVAGPRRRRRPGRREVHAPGGRGGRRPAGGRAVRPLPRRERVVRAGR